MVGSFPFDFETSLTISVDNFLVINDPLPAEPQFLASLGLYGILDDPGDQGVSITLETNPTQGDDPNEYFQVIQPPDRQNGPSIRMKKGIDADVSNYTKWNYKSMVNRVVSALHMHVLEWTNEIEHTRYKTVP